MALHARGGAVSAVVCVAPAMAQERRLTTNPAHQRSPAISGNLVVWEDCRNATDEYCNNPDIYLYDLAFDTE